MAVYTALSLVEADRISHALGLGAAIAVTGIAAGTVNSNFWLETARGTYFLRIYEEQDLEGVTYESALLDHLAAQGIPVPRRVPPVLDSALRLGSKPVGVFDRMTGAETCQAGVTRDRTRALGAWLARCHGALDGFAVRREGRFTLANVRARLDAMNLGTRTEFASARQRLTAVVEELSSFSFAGCPEGVIHGDLFRDNVRWEGSSLVGILDWESAADGVRVYDLAVTWLAWCFGDCLDWELSRAMFDGYQSVRALELAEWAALRAAARAACARFATTRITDIALRETAGARVHKDYRRFLGRLDAVEATTDEELRASLGGEREGEPARPADPFTRR